MNRRSFLGLVLATQCAPAICKAGNLMRWTSTRFGLAVPEWRLRELADNMLIQAEGEGAWMYIEKNLWWYEFSDGSVMSATDAGKLIVEKSGFLKVLNDTPGRDCGFGPVGRTFDGDGNLVQTWSVVTPDPPTLASPAPSQATRRRDRAL